MHSFSGSLLPLLLFSRSSAPRLEWGWGATLWKAGSQGQCWGGREQLQGHWTAEAADEMRRGRERGDRGALGMEAAEVSEMRLNDKPKVHLHRWVGLGGGSCGEIGKGTRSFFSILSLSLHTDTHTSLIKSQRLTLFSLHFHKGPPGKEAVKGGKEGHGEGMELLSPLGSASLCTCLGKTGLWRAGVG